MTSRVHCGLAKKYLSIRLGKISAVIFFLHFFVASAFAWGPMGHSIIGEIAQSKLLPEVRGILRDQFQTSSLANISNWADQVKKRKKNHGITQIFRRESWNMTVVVIVSQEIA